MNSTLRLEALTQSGLLRKSAAERLHHLAYTAVALLQVDACQINALDDKLQHTVTGYPPNPLVFPAADTPVELSGCQEVVLTGRPLVIPDVRDHPIMCALPWAENWKGYLGVPVVYELQVIGTVCVLTKAPRVWKTYETIALQGIARLVGASLDTPQQHLGETA